MGIKEVGCVLLLMEMDFLQIKEEQEGRRPCTAVVPPLFDELVTSRNEFAKRLDVLISDLTLTIITCSEFHGPRYSPGSGPN